MRRIMPVDEPRLINPIESMRVIAQLGEGVFAEVFLIEDEKTNKQYALKKSIKCSDYISREIDILYKLRNKDYVIHMYTAFYTQDFEYELCQNILLEYIPYNLHQLISDCRRRGRILDEQELRKLYRGMLLGLQEMHSENIAHRDLKPENILLNENLEITISDLGAAKHLPSQNQHNPAICSMYYRAPELIQGSIKYSVQADMWSIACIMVELITYKPLFYCEGEDQLFPAILHKLGGFNDHVRDYYSYYVLEENAESIWNIDQQFQQDTFIFQYMVQDRRISPLLADFLERLFCYIPEQRLTAETALSHPFFGDQSQYIIEDMRRHQMKELDRKSFVMPPDFRPFEPGTEELYQMLYCRPYIIPVIDYDGQFRYVQRFERIDGSEIIPEEPQDDSIDYDRHSLPNPIRNPCKLKFFGSLFEEDSVGSDIFGEKKRERQRLRKEKQKQRQQEEQIEQDSEQEQEQQKNSEYQVESPQLSNIEQQQAQKPPVIFTRELIDRIYEQNRIQLQKEIQSHLEYEARYQLYQQDYLRQLQSQGKFEQQGQFQNIYENRPNSLIFGEIRQPTILEQLQQNPLFRQQRQPSVFAQQQKQSPQPQRQPQPVFAQSQQQQFGQVQQAQQPQQPQQAQQPQQPQSPVFRQTQQQSEFVQEQYQSPLFRQNQQQSGFAQEQQQKKSLFGQMNQSQSPVFGQTLQQSGFKQEQQCFGQMQQQSPMPRQTQQLFAQEQYPRSTSMFGQMQCQVPSFGQIQQTPMFGQIQQPPLFGQQQSNPVFNQSPTIRIQVPWNQEYLQFQQNQQPIQFQQNQQSGQFLYNQQQKQAIRNQQQQGIQQNQGSFYANNNPFMSALSNSFGRYYRLIFLQQFLIFFKISPNLHNILNIYFQFIKLRKHTKINDHLNTVRSRIVFLNFPLDFLFKKFMNYIFFIFLIKNLFF